MYEYSCPEDGEIYAKVRASSDTTHGERRDGTLCGKIGRLLGAWTPDGPHAPGSDVDRYASEIMGEIEQDIVEMTVPYDVSTFMELHDYVDANMYVENAHVPYIGEDFTLVNAVTDEVNRRLMRRTAYTYEARQINLNRVAYRITRDFGLYAAVHNTGGGTATVCIGEPDDNARYPVTIGPGYFVGEGSRAYAYVAEIAIGPGEAPDAEPPVIIEVCPTVCPTTEDETVNSAIDMYRRIMAQPWTGPQCRLCGTTDHNPAARTAPVRLSSVHPGQTVVYAGRTHTITEIDTRPDGIVRLTMGDVGVGDKPNAIIDVVMDPSDDSDVDPCVCGKVADGPDVAAHWDSLFGATVIVFSCSLPCADVIDSLRDESQRLTREMVDAERARRADAPV